MLLPMFVHEGFLDFEMGYKQFVQPRQGGLDQVRLVLVGKYLLQRSCLGENYLVLDVDLRISEYMCPNHDVVS